ncbi:MAG TPA: PIN domain-containing protein [Candidatus Binatia bacterium]|jgi:predicted nucleic acid-binding protein|nr:PIN domain-containing protein [Candidatus Binatia bacterium]
MERVVFDTDLYIDWLQEGLREELILERTFLRHMSTVVLLELRAGAFTPAAIRVVENLYATFSRARRLLAPTPATFWQAGAILATLQRRLGYDLKKRTRLVNDCLIALSSRQVGATVFTRNARDFEAIRRVAPFKLIVVL